MTVARLRVANRDRPTEKTPKGYEVPVPERREFFANLKKAAKPEKGKDSGSASGSRKK